MPAIDNAIPLIRNTLSAIQNAVDPNAFPGLGDAVTALHTANQQAVVQFFAAYPELAPQSAPELIRSGCRVSIPS